jgi:hypothetical protein
LARRYNACDDAPGAFLRVIGPILTRHDCAYMLTVAKVIPGLAKHTDMPGQYQKLLMIFDY